MQQTNPPAAGEDWNSYARPSKRAIALTNSSGSTGFSYHSSSTSRWHLPSRNLMVGYGTPNPSDEFYPSTPSQAAISDAVREL